MHLRILARLILVVAVLILSGSCGKDRVREIPRDDLVRILVEMHFAEGMKNTGILQREYPRVDSFDLMTPILEKHGYTHREFDSTVASYARKPDQYDKIYDEVIMELTRLQDELNRPEEPAKK